MNALGIIGPRKAVDKRWSFGGSPLLDTEARTHFRQKIISILNLSESNLIIHPDREFTTGPRNKKELDKLIKVSLYLIEEAVKDIFKEIGIPFTPAKLVLFSGSTNTGCGEALTKSGPFYCPIDKNIYLDPQFFIDMLELYPKSEDFVVFYVLAHEYGHYLQNVINFHKQELQIGRRIIKASNIIDLQNKLRDCLPESEHNKISQVIELFADYTAGLITRYANIKEPFLEKNDIIEGVEAALYIGDDMIQHRSGQRVTPYKFTHGVGEQRAAAFADGLKNGSIHILSIKTFIEILLKQLRIPQDEVILFDI